MNEDFTKRDKTQAIELLDKRNEFQKVFLYEDGLCEYDFNKKPFHFKNKKGEWEDIVTTLNKDETNKKIYNYQNSLKCLLDENPENINNILVEDNYNNKIFHDLQGIFAIYDGAEELIETPKKPKFNDVEESPNGDVYYIQTEVFKDISLIYQSIQSAFKVDVMFYKNFEFEGEVPNKIELVYNLEIDGEYNFEINGKKKHLPISSLSSVDIIFKESGIRIKEPFIEDSNGYKFPVEIKILEKNDKLQLRYSIDYGIFNKPYIKYPLRLDPYDETRNFGHSGNYSFPISFPQTFGFYYYVHGYDGGCYTQCSSVKLINPTGSTVLNVSECTSKSKSGTNYYDAFTTSLIGTWNVENSTQTNSSDWSRAEAYIYTDPRVLVRQNGSWVGLTELAKGKTNGSFEDIEAYVRIDGSWQRRLPME